MKYYKIKPEGLNSMICKLKNVIEYLKKAYTFEIIKIEIIEMTEEEYGKLPESNGF